MEKEITITKEEFAKKLGKSIAHLTMETTKEDGAGALVMLLMGAKIMDAMVKDLFGEQNNETETEPKTEPETEEINKDEVN